jgi:hypothetical protein
VPQTGYQISLTISSVFEIAVLGLCHITTTSNRLYYTERQISSVYRKFFYDLFKIRLRANMLQIMRQFRKYR